ncbi:hypothetical protein PUN28_020840 [Cardiocondyla obscurior]|uniref:Uncharacterized protein n=1 Tax=Cardiocondyla obscurior TaxID=286306 RepID=A0AAW2EAU9_9HYME
MHLDRRRLAKSTWPRRRALHPEDHDSATGSLMLRSIRNADLGSRVLKGGRVRSTPLASRAEFRRSERENCERQEFLAETKIASPRGLCSGIGCSLESERIKTVPLSPNIDFLYVKSDDAGLPGLSGARDWHMQMILQ